MEGGQSYALVGENHEGDKWIVTDRETHDSNDNLWSAIESMEKIVEH